MLEPVWLCLSLEIQNININTIVSFSSADFCQKPLSLDSLVISPSRHTHVLSCLKGHWLPYDPNFSPYPGLINKIFVIFPESADLLNKMDSLTNIFISSVRQSLSHISVKMRPEFHMIHCMFHTQTTFITVALTGCPQSLLNSLTGWLNITSHAWRYFSEICDTCHFSPLYSGFPNAC